MHTTRLPFLGGAAQPQGLALEQGSALEAGEYFHRAKVGGVDTELNEGR